MSFISLPCAPAFINIAPPIVPGIPDISSNPVISSFNNFCAKNPIGVASSTVISILFCSFGSIFISFKFVLITIPFIPLSDTNTLLPFPNIVIFIFSFLANSNIFCSSFIDVIFI